MDEAAEMAAWLERGASDDWRPLTTAELADQCVEFAKDLARYKAVQRWRKKSGSKRKYKDIIDEYLAWLPEERQKEFGCVEIINGESTFRLFGFDCNPNPIDLSMAEDGWTHPLLAPTDSRQGIYRLMIATGIVQKASEQRIAAAWM